MRIQRNKLDRTDGSEEETIHVSGCSFNSPEAVEQLGHELLQAAAEWRAEIDKRGPPGPPAFKTFELIAQYGGRNKIASWVEHPWALARHGRGTSPVFLVKAGRDGSFRAWIVSVTFENGEHRWKCRFQRSSTVETRDLIQAFPHTLPDSPTLGDIELAREKARVSRGAP